MLNQRFACRYAPRVRVWLAVAVGGACGAIARWLVGEGVHSWLGPAADFPWGTLLVNVIGCALIGVVAPILVGGRAWITALVVTGFLGGFTTYSAFAEETFALADRGDSMGLVLAGLYVVATIAATSVAVALGRWTSTRLSPRHDLGAAS